MDYIIVTVIMFAIGFFIFYARKSSNSSNDKRLTEVNGSGPSRAKCCKCNKELSKYSGDWFAETYGQFEGVVCKSCGKILCDKCHPPGQESTCSICKGELLPCLSKNLTTFYKPLPTVCINCGAKNPGSFGVLYRTKSYSMPNSIRWEILGQEYPFVCDMCIRFIKSWKKIKLLFAGTVTASIILVFVYAFIALKNENVFIVMFLVLIFAGGFLYEAYKEFSKSSDEIRSELAYKKKAGTGIEENISYLTERMLINLKKKSKI